MQGFHTIALLLLLLCMVMVESSAQEGCFNVVEFGAVGDGETDDSEVKNKIKITRTLSCHLTSII